MNKDLTKFGHNFSKNKPFSKCRNIPTICRIEIKQYYVGIFGSLKKTNTLRQRVNCRNIPTF